MMRQQGSKISVEQKHVIIEFMEQQNIDFAQATAMKVKYGPTYNELWSQLTQILNKTPGPKKDKIQWQKVWSGIKKGIKIKLKKIQIYQDKNTGQCIYYPRLTDIDERIIALLKNKTEKSKERDLISLEEVNNQKNKTVETKSSKIKIKSENSPNTSMLMEHILISDDEKYSETSYEECSNMSWSSHDNRSTKENENESITTTTMLRKTIDAISLQLEQLIEQNSVTNILLERIATTLENRQAQS